MAETHILKIDSLPVVERGNGIRTTPLVTKEIGAKHITTGDPLPGRHESPAPFT